MQWVLFKSSWDANTESVVFQGVYAGADGNLELCGGYIGRKLPPYLLESVPPNCEKRFGMSDMLMNDGRIVTVIGDGAIPLNGIKAVWIPDLSIMLPELLNHYNKYVRPQESDKPVPVRRAEGYQVQQSSEIAVEIRDRKVLLFTGAGISLASGLPDLDELSLLVQSILTPVDSYFRDLLRGTKTERLMKARQYVSAFTQSEPNRAHWVIAELCKTHGWQLATGNFDGLHEKTGVTPIFQNSDEVVIPDLGTYDVMITVGLRDGIGRVADEYRKLNPYGRIIAINPEPPWYLGSNDIFVSGSSDEVLDDVRRILKSE